MESKRIADENKKNRFDGREKILDLDNEVNRWDSKYQDNIR